MNRRHSAETPNGLLVARAPLYRQHTQQRNTAGHDRRYAMNIDKIGTELGWEPRYSLYEGLDKTIDWYLSNFEWISKAVL